MKRRGELRMIQRAINQGWPTPPEEQRKAFELIMSTLGDDNATAREREAALKCLGALVQHEGSTDSQIAKRADDALRYHEQKRIEK